MIPNHTARCGIYCPDCIRHRNAYSGPAQELREQLARAGMRNYAVVESPFGNQALGEYPAFQRVLNALCEMQCSMGCREGNGCGGVPCEIMKCCAARRFQGCWECDDLENCGKFAFLTPRCGDMPKANCRAIREQGIVGWESRRTKFYVWL